MSEAITAALRMLMACSRIAVPLRDGPRVLGAINMLWLKTAFSIEDFAAHHLAALQGASAEIVGSLRSRTRR
jgi:IclR family mhp operon transcriptional activator